MIRNISRLSICAILGALPASAWAAINGLHSDPRVFNNNPTSTLTIVNSNTIPGHVNIDDRSFTGTGTNRHDVCLSTDNGATDHLFPITEGFTIKANVTLNDGSNSPRKEAGFRINTSPAAGQGDALFIINSDAGEIVAFGGPFYNFRSPPYNEPAYVPGQTILMGMTYTPGAPGTLEYFIDRGSGIESSGPLPITNTEGGFVDFHVCMYGQVNPSSTNVEDFLNVDFNNIMASSLVPEPASMALIGLGGIAFLRRRRNALTA